MAGIIYSMSINDATFQAGIKRAIASVEKLDAIIDKKRSLGGFSGGGRGMFSGGGRGMGGSRSMMAGMMGGGAGMIGGGAGMMMGGPWGLAAMGIGLATEKVYEFEKGVVTSFGTYEKFIMSTTALLNGNRKEAIALNDELTKLAVTSPFSYLETQEGARQLIGYGVAVGDVMTDLKKLGDVAAGSGLEFNNLVYAFGKIKTQGIATMRELRMFRGVPMMDELKEHFKVNGEELMKMIKQHKVTWEVVDGILNELTNKGGLYYQQMKVQSESVAGRLTNLGDSWELLKRHVGESQEGMIKSGLDWAYRMVGHIDMVINANNKLNASYKNAGIKTNSENDIYNTNGFWANLIGTISGGTYRKGLEQDKKMQDLVTLLDKIPQGTLEEIDNKRQGLSDVKKMYQSDLATNEGTIKYNGYRDPKENAR